MARLDYVIDMKNCIACHACAVACKVENNLPDGHLVGSRSHRRR